MKKLPLSTLAIVVVLFTCLFIDFNLKLWKSQDRVIEGDVHSYYAYLPATYIYNDIELTKSDYRFEGNYFLFWPNTTKEGKKVIKTNMGMSIMYAPFFFVANAFSSLTNYAENGFSEPFKIFLLFSAIFYLFIGLDYVRKILRYYYFSDSNIAIVLLLIGLGTNLLCYSSQSGPMPHVYNFCLFSIFIYYTIKWYEKHSVKNTIILGLLLGLISLIRPSNSIIIIFFAFYNVYGITELKQRMVFLKSEWFLVNVIFFFAFIAWIPQLMYWKTISGSYFYDAYEGERFFFNDPKLVEVLFGFRKGWLIYTPMMAFALAGIFLMKDSLKKLRLPLILFLLMNIYVISSWWCWWYGDSYGQRSMIDCYPLLAIPFASFIKDITGRKIIYKLIFYGCAVFFISLNIFQTFQFEYHSLHHDGMTKKLYFKQFGRLDKISDYEQYVNYPDYDEAKKGKRSVIDGSKAYEKEYFGGKNVLRKQLVNLKALNNKYVCADAARNNNVMANRDEASIWETFSLIVFDDNECAVRSFKNLFFSAELGEQNQITATRERAEAWEFFTMVKLDSNYVAFKAANGKYLTVDEKSQQLFAKGDSIGGKEKFILGNKLGVGK